MNDERLSALVDRYLDGQLTPTEKAELEDSLRRSAAAREQFWRETRLHALLHEVENDAAGVDTAVVRAAKRLPLSRKVWVDGGRGRVPGVTVTAAAYFWSRPTPVSEPTTAAVAVLTRAGGRAVERSGPGVSHRRRARAGLAAAEKRTGSGGILQRRQGAARRAGRTAARFRQPGVLSARAIERRGPASSRRLHRRYAAGQCGGPWHGLRPGCHRATARKSTSSRAK